MDFSPDYGIPFDLKEEGGARAHNQVSIEIQVVFNPVVNRGGESGSNKRGIGAKMSKFG